jgi:leader peptidase (prepilin peptidase) / N-methyltransferase
VTEATLAWAGAPGWIVVAVAPFVGSFLGVLIRRLPEGRSAVFGRSCCEHCGVGLAVRDLVPLASWLATLGRCRGCGARLGWFYPGVEAAAIAVALVSMWIDRGADVWLDAFFGWWLLALGWIDARDGILPDVLTLPLLLAGIAATAMAPGEATDRVGGAVGGYLLLAGVGWAYRRWRGREGLGQGDAKLFAATGAWVGISGLPSVLLVAAGSALLAAAGLNLAGWRLGRHSALPFGPFLAVAAWAIWLFGPLGL